MGFLKDLVIKLGLDSSGVDKGVNKAGSSLDKLKSTVGKLGAAFGIAFGVSEVINFGKELFNLAAKAEGVRKAFERIAPSGLLADLRRSTRGAVSDFDLMKNAVSASNFKIPLENLGSYLAFATKRAEETGQSVDYLVDSIIMGIGRKSPMILDNLGISIVDIRNEMEKTGDMAKAVANIIDREMANAGNTVDTSATKVAQMTTAWTNFKEALGTQVTQALADSTNWLTRWIIESKKILDSDIITWYEKLSAVMPSGDDFRGMTLYKISKDEGRKKTVDTEAGFLAANMPKSTETSATKLDKWIKSQKELLKIEGQYNVLNVANLKVWEARRKELSDAAAKEEERLAKQEEEAKTAQENARKALEAEQKKKAEAEASKKLAEQNIAANKASINDYETLIKLNDERYKLATSDMIRNQILKENAAYKLQLSLIDNISRAAEINGKRLKEGKVTGVKSLNRDKVDISGLNTDDLTLAMTSDAVDKYEEQLRRVEDLSNEFKATMQGTMMDAFSSFGEALGGMNDLNAGQIVAKLLSPFADLAIKAGTIILTSGIAIDGLKKALLSLNGPVAIAAGAALIAVGVAAKAGLAALAGGGGNSSKQSSVSGGSFTPNNSYMQERAVTVQVEGRIKGNDIYISNSKESNRRNNGF